MEKTREKTIIQTSIIGILTNLGLAAFKAVIGILSGSIAVLLDAVNNLSDALSSIITIVGTKLAGKLPDKKHPLGYGRIEYLSAMMVAGIVLYAGITSFVESVKKIIHPQKADYSLISLIIITVAVFVKLALGIYVKRQGEKVKSASLVASGSDALFDAVLSTSVLASAILFLVTGLALEAFVGVAISIFIIRAGIEMMTETLDEILGMRADKELTDHIKQILRSEPGVQGAYDLILYNFGPNKNYASVHLELPDTMTVQEVDTLTRRAEAHVYKETGVVLTGVGVYSHNTQGGYAAEMENAVRKIVLQYDFAIQLHGFFVDVEQKWIRFDVVVSFEWNPQECLEILYSKMQESFPDYSFQIAPDVDVSD